MSGARAGLAAASGIARLAPPARRGMRLPIGGILVGLWFGFAYVFLLAPMIVVIGASFNGGTEYSAVSFPPRDPTLKWYFRIPESQFEALGLSLGLAGFTAVVACLLGIPAALGIVRGKMPFKPLVVALFRTPLQIPAVVTGVAFLQFYYILGDATGLYVNGSFIGLALGHIFVATPYVIGTVVAILQRFDVRLEEAALILGASRWRAFRRVTLPVIMPGVYAGALYAFMTSFADVPIAIFLSAPGFVTYPVDLFFGMENEFSAAMLASATLVIFFCLAMLLVIQRLVGFDALLRAGGR